MSRTKTELPSTREVKYSEGIDLVFGDGISPEEEELVRKKVEDRQKEAAAEAEANPEAKYTLEVMFSHDFSIFKPSVGAVSFWEQGAFGGSGDTKLYICPGKKEKMNECEAFIPIEAMGMDIVPCPTCGIAWDAKKLSGEVLARLDTAGWADCLLKFFMKLQMDADIRVKYHPDDIRSVAMREQEESKRGDLLNPARARRAVVTHKMRDIIRETSAGADLRKCILTRLRS